MFRTSTEKIHSGRRVAVAATTVLIMALAAVTFYLAGPALAQTDGSLQSEAERVRAEVAGINQSAEQAVERYNQANLELEGTRQKIADNENAIEEASAKLSEAQNQLNSRIAGIYRSGSLGIMDVILNTSTFSELLTRFDMLGKISDQDKADIEKVLKYKAEVESAQAELEQTRQEQEELVETLAAEKSQIESQLAARQAVLSNVNSEVAQLIAQEQGSQPTAPSPAGPGTGLESSTAAGTIPSPGPVYAPVPAPAPPPSAGGAVSIAMQYLGVPYVWGGASPAGFDCSGLVMYVYAQLGIYLPHSAAAQYYAGTPISYSQLAPGDLVFFGSPISHVGIYIGGGSMIHAPFEGTVVSISGIGGSYSGAARL